MKIYLDVCCLNRPFDDQSQDRIRLETEAVLLILARFEIEHWLWMSSEVVLDEILQTRDRNRRRRLLDLNAKADVSLIISDSDFERALELVRQGFGDMDSLHLACAEHNNIDVFLTTDDKLMRKANHLVGQLNVLVANPLKWLFDQKETEE